MGFQIASNHLLISIAIIVILILIALKYFKKFSKISFSIFYPVLSQKVNDYAFHYKKDLFQDLQNRREATRGKNPIKILELGAGPGNNFEFYPKNSKLIIVEPNEYFQNKRGINLSKVPGLTIDREFIGFGEDLSFIPSNSIDFAVVTFVLCSVKNMEQVLKEIHRVLIPGGKFFFMEHGCKVNNGKRRWQHFINPFWKIIADGCNINRDSATDIRNSGLFINVKTQIIPPLSKPWYLTLIHFSLGHIVFGTAQNCN